ncbi:hypothetical protein LTR37_007630 [Vermiconidia calcicola]|uniref:Uncharacterized protein n=1 Tax=Vermiconidia calcicola TaxID=1690605 RepID=A0ACC3NEG7_9PEZI|nr:hypothetical protein LTR37_007630 [Vermiconidia calcicola]
MESSRKRKASNATPSSADGSASKKLRLLNSTPAARSTVQEVGQKILEHLQHASDKNGRLIATQFRTLPGRRELPEYYNAIQLPIALDTISDKLKRNAYPTVTTLESDFKRMIQNAKDFNDPKSEIYEDAERIRKLVFNFMKVNNPAYKEDSKYSAFPTPTPQSEAAPVQNGAHKADNETAPGSREMSSKPRQAPASRVSEEPDQKASVAPSATTGEDAGDDEDGEEEGGDDIEFAGKNFQEAQQMMISYLLKYQDAEGLEIYSPFGNLPTRKLEDYYKVIRHPVSLKSVAKRARGQHGRAPPTGVTDFKTWDAFQDEVSFIWRNAQDYNEDGSDMYNLASDFREHFQTLLAEAREKVEEPSGPRLKLGGPKPKVTLNLSQHRASPAPGVSVDNDALARQKQMVQAGVNGQQTGQQPQRGAPNAHGTSHMPPAAVRPSSNTHSGSPINGAVKTEKTSTLSPAPPNGVPVAPTLTNGMMPPPTMRPTSSSPYPSLPPTAGFPYTAPALLPPAQLRPYPKEAALLPNVTIATHPQLKVTKTFSMSVTPHATLSHQSTTTTLPPTHYFMQISPTISKQLSLNRPYKMFVTVNGTRLTQRDTQFHNETGKRTHVYEGSLAQGVNRIEIEVAAAKLGDERGLDVEKVTVFANLMR